VALIPTTLQITTFGNRQVGDEVNLECDVLVKTIVATMERLEALRRG
jgi:riboflavin synthase alpha subunit